VKIYLLLSQNLLLTHVICTYTQESKQKILNQKSSHLALQRYSDKAALHFELLHNDLARRRKVTAPKSDHF
jgi:hypothetical protein